MFHFRSHVGRIGLRQYILVGRGCDTVGSLLHQLLHAAGLWHEHTRPDRDTSVKINFENVAEGAVRNSFTLRNFFKAGCNVDHIIALIDQRKVFHCKGQISFLFK